MMLPLPAARGLVEPQKASRVCPKPVQAAGGRAADVEARAGAAQVSLPVPAHISLKLVDRIEAAPLNQALRQTERHRRVVRPLAGIEIERTAAGDIRQRLERARRLELDRRAQRIACGQANQRAAISILHGHGWRLHA